MKRIISGLLVICLTITMVFSLTACNTKDLKDKEYNNKVNSYKFWENDITEAIPQTNVSYVVRDFLNTPSKDGKKKKVLFLGYDGVRADRIPTILNKDTGKKIEGVDSAILDTIGEDGGIYLAYAGGNKGTKTCQPTVTGCGWGSLLTGVWADKHNIKDNRDVKNPNYTSFVFDAVNGKFNNGQIFTSAFISSCTQHFATQYIDEINTLRDYVKEGGTMPALKQHEEFIREKKKWSENYYDDDVRDYVKAVIDNTSKPIDYIFTTNNKPEGYVGYYGDITTKDEMIKAINNDTEVIFGILEETDHVGHNKGFSKGANESPEYNEAFTRQDKIGSEVIRAALKHAEENNEDWLILVTTDHGGYDDYHGKHSYEERTIWVACNKKIPNSYYSVGYNGLKAK